MISFNFDNYDVDTLNESELLLDILNENIMMSNKLAELGYVNEVKSYSGVTMMLKYIFVQFKGKKRTLEQIDKDIKRCDDLIAKLEEDMEAYKKYGTSKKVAYNIINLVCKILAMPGLKEPIKPAESQPYVKERDLQKAGFDTYKHDILLSIGQTKSAKRYLEEQKARLMKDK